MSYDDIEDDSPRPRKRQSKDSGSKNVVIIVLAAVAGFFLLGCVVFAALLLPAVQQAREAARRSVSQNNLKQLGLAMHNYHDTFRQFPPGGIYGADGQAYHSWQTMLLPYIEQAHLYSMVDFDVPWTAPVNRGPLSSSIPAFLNPSEPNTAPVGGYAVSHYAANRQLLTDNGGEEVEGIMSFTDGLSNTMLAGEVGGGFRAWADPENRRDPAAGIGPGPDQFGRSTGKGCNILMCDGSVRWINEDIDPGVLRALANPRDGVVPPSDF